MLLPCLQRGRIESTAAPNAAVELAFAVNGVLRGVTRTYQLSGHQNDWFVMLPEDAFGANKFDLQVFTTSGTGDGRQLTPVRVVD